MAMEMVNLRMELGALCEAIEAVVFTDDYGSEDLAESRAKNDRVKGDLDELWRIPTIPELPKEKINVLLSWEEAAPFLDYCFLNDRASWMFARYSIAWTATRVITTGELGIRTVPRNPTNFKPPLKDSEEDNE